MTKKIKKHGLLELMEILNDSFLIGVAVGGILIWIIYKLRRKGQVSLKEHMELLESNSVLKIKYEDSLSNSEKFEKKYYEEFEKSRILSQSVSYKNAEIQSLKERIIEKEELINNLQTSFTKQFEAIANRILIENSGKLNKQTSETLSYILSPLKERLEKFEEKIEESREKQLRESISLKSQIAQLEKLNQTLSSDAKNLTTALKGDSKVRGYWGEMVLERLLEKSGLQKGIHYESQYPLKNEETGDRFQPDFVIFLPEEKNLVIDSKLSLLAYERYTQSEIDSEKEDFLKDHIQSIETHIRTLSKKNYQDLYGIHSPDFVLMFIAIEPSFTLAIQSRPELYNFALDKNVVLVTASTLLATLRIIDNIWKQEKQNKNVLEIAKQSGLLYDKFVNFVGDLKKIGLSLEQADKSYTQALKRLSEGQGNLIVSAEKIRDLGAKNSKSLPSEFLNNT